MIFTETTLAGAYIIDLEKIEDERGFFARSWCEREFDAHGFDSRLVQCNVSFSKKRGTLRGLHYQAAPHEETKLVRCTKGSLFDVIVDLRKDSPTFLKWVGVKLTAANRRMLYIPKRFAHGFQTLENQTEIFYQMSEFFYQDAARGIRWDDPSIAVAWPRAERTISKRDQAYTDLEKQFVGL